MLCVDIVTTEEYYIHMSSLETIQIRIDAKTKKAARKTLDGIGLDMSSAIKLFLVNVINTQGIPLDLRTENGFTLAQEQVLQKETEEAKKNGKGYTDLDELFSDLDL
jgi:DNA-damage-inducible protein J